MPATVPNQKIATIKKEPCDQHNLYAKINIAAMKNAMNNLGNAEFEIWIYFAKNQDGYPLAISPTAAADWGISRTTFNRTIHKFINEGYLIADHEGSNHYIFYEKPREKGTFTPYHGSTNRIEEGYDWSF